MALHELHRQDFTIFKAQSATSTARVPAASATIGIFREGATAQGAGSEVGAGATITVHDPGAIVAGDTVSVGTSLTTVSRTVSSVTSTTIVVAAGGVGAFVWADGTRITPTNNRPLTYTDDQGAETTTTPSQVTTDSLGEAFCYTRTAHIEALVTDGATLTLLQDLTGVGGRYEVAPADWGARFDGATDDQAAFADALEYIKAKGGGILRLPPGTTRLGSTVTLATMSNVQIVGAGRGITTVEINHAGTGFDLTGTANDIGISGMTIKRLTGSGDDIQIALGIGRTGLRDLVFDGGGIGVDDHGTDTRIRDVWMTGTGWTSFVRLDTSTRCQIDSLVADPGANWTRGIDIDTGTVSTRITNLDIEPTGAFSGIGVHVRDSAAGNDPTDIVLTEPHLECGTTGNCVEITACVGFRLNGGTMLDSSRGVVVNGGVSIKLIGTNIVGMQAEAVDINAGSHIRITEIDTSDNNVAAGGTFDIDIAAGVDDVSVNGFNFGRFWRSASSGTAGLSIAAGASDRLQFLGGRNDGGGASLFTSANTSQLADYSHLMQFGTNTMVHTAMPTGGFLTSGVKTMTGAETTTSVANIHQLILNQSGNTVWTALTSALSGQVVRVVNIHATSTATFNDGGSLLLTGNHILGQNDILELMWVSALNSWVQIAQAAN